MFPNAHESGDAQAWRERALAPSGAGEESAARRRRLGGAAAGAGVDSDVASALKRDRFAGLRSEIVLGRRVPVADTYRSRLLGLAFLAPERAPDGLLIPRCRSIHTFGMRFAIDVVYLDAAGCEIGRVAGVGPRRLLSEPGAAAVLELLPGTTSAAP